VKNRSTVPLVVTGITAFFGILGYSQMLLDNPLRW
jgi:hypothetical protein